MHLRSGKILDFSKTLVMGILNLTPDSFSDGGRFTDLDNAVEQARKMIVDGADIIDIGGESSRPGSDPVSAETEIARIIPVIEKIRKFSEIPISIDTTKAIVADKAITAGAELINDISAMNTDSKMADIVKQNDIPIILMHMKGMPKTMQANPTYEDCIHEIINFFKERIIFCENNSIDKSKIIIDPGIGFGKRLEDNLAIIRQLHLFKELNVPIMLGASRKSFIGMITGAMDNADKRIGGSLAAVIAAVNVNCDIVRVHDVAETIEAIKVAKAIKQAG